MYNSKDNKNSKKVAKEIKKRIERCHLFEAKNANLKKFQFIFIIAPNVGDEEIPENIENYIIKTKTQNKNYFLCELGNYLGLDYKGCGDNIQEILKIKKWEMKSKILLDSFPEPRMKEIAKWIKECKKIIKKYGS